MNKNLQRFITLAVLVLFTLSIVPVAFAEETSEREQARERAARMMKKDAAMERAEAFREQLQEKKERFTAAREAFLEKKERLSELKHRATQCVNDSEDCRTKKSDLKRGVKDHLIKTAELIDKSLEKLIERVNDSKVLSEQEKQDALNRLTELEKQVEEQVAELEALPDTTTNEELRTHIKELKDLWHKVRKEQRWVITQLTNHKQDNLVEIYVRFGDRAEAQIAKLTAQGADVAALEELLVKYQESVEALKVAQGEAKVAWLDAKSSPEALEHARTLQQAFREHAKETKASLRNLLQELKEVRQQVGSEEGSEVEEEATAETVPSTETPAGETEPATAE
ncbi:MAG TPA: hypothetical protein VJI32_03160 [Candidatus Nanoarchaeia archaeon]|nr:hypothetical protein [Candidatus Nanoarchaeia archaeon]